MCLAVPAVVRSRTDAGMGDVDIMGVSRTVSLDLVPKATVGDYVLVHAGFAIEIVDEKFANESLELIKELPFLTDEESGLGLPQDQVDAMHIGENQQDVADTSASVPTDPLFAPQAEETTASAPASGN